MTSVEVTSSSTSVLSSPEILDFFSRAKEKLANCGFLFNVSRNGRSWAFFAAPKSALNEFFSGDDVYFLGEALSPTWGYPDVVISREAVQVSGNDEGYDSFPYRFRPVPEAVSEDLLIPVWQDCISAIPLLNRFTVSTQVDF